MRKFWLPLLLGLLVTVVLFPLGVIYSKGGGETFSIIFFPFTSLLGLILPSGANKLAIALGYTLFFLQYPLYGVILKIALDRGKFYKGLLSLLGLHIMCSLIALRFTSSEI
jgi:hypothetical protein